MSQTQPVVSKSVRQSKQIKLPPIPPGELERLKARHPQPPHPPKPPLPPVATRAPEPPRAPFPPPPLPVDLRKIPITIYLTPRQLAMVQQVAEYDRHASVEDCIVDDLRGNVICFREGCTKQNGEEAGNEWDSDGTPTQLVTVTLDQRASALVRDYIENGHPCLTEGHDPRDLMSAAAVFLLEDPDNGSDWTSSDDALGRARERRLAANGREAL